MHRIIENKPLELFVIDLFVLDQFVGFRQHARHVLHVEVADVGAEQRLDLRVAGIDRAVKRPGVGGVVGFAAEVERLDEQVEKVLLVSDAAGSVVVEVVDSTGGVGAVVRADAASPGDGVGERFARVLRRQFAQQPHVEVRRVRVRERFAIAYVPVAHEIGQQEAREAGAAFEEGEVEIRETPRDAAEKDRLAHRFACCGEVADVVVAEVRGRIAEGAAPPPAMKRRRYLQFQALAPDRIVVVGAIEAQHVVPGAGTPLNRPFHHAVQHDHLEPEFADSVFEFGDRLVRRVRRDHCSGRNPVGKGREQIRLVDVERATRRHPRLFVVAARQAHAGRGEKHGEVDAEFIQPLVQERRHHGGGAVARVPGGDTPERLLRHVFGAALFDVHRQ